MSTLLRYASGRGSAQGLAQVMRAFFGYDATYTETECLISKVDPSITRGPKRILDLGPEITLAGKSHEEIAEQLLPKTPSFLEDYRPEVPAELAIRGDFGLSSDLERATTAVEIADRAQLRGVLVEYLLPLVATELQATHCATLVIDAEEQQRRLSVSKIALLAQRYGIERAKRLAKEQNVLTHIVPHPLSALSYIGAYTVFSPWALALPISRRDRIWLFYKDGGWVFGKGGAISFLEQLQTDLSPRSAKAYTVLLKELGRIPLKDKWSYLRLAVRSIDNLLRFVNDPRSFESDGGEVDVLHQIQAMSAVNLLFADLRALATSPQSHARITFAFSAIDKLANLKKKLSASTASEVELAKSFTSLVQRRAIRDSFRSTRFIPAEAVTKQLVASTLAFLNCHRELRQQLGAAGVVEADRLKALRTLRNLHHGTFLDRAAFEELFLEHEGVVPNDLGAIPILLCLSAGLDPEQFFELSR